MSGGAKAHQLPHSFTNVPAVALPKASVAVHKPTCDIKAVHGHLKKACEQEKKWLEHASQLLAKEEVVKGDCIAWSAYHASFQDSPAQEVEAAITQLLPLFNEKAATPAMIKH